VKQTIIDETSDEPSDMAVCLVSEEAARSVTDVVSSSQEVETTELPDEARTEDALPSDICPDSVQPCAVTDQQTEEAVAVETSAAAEEIRSQTFASSEPGRQEGPETTPVESAEVFQSEQLPVEATELHKDAEAEPAAETSEDIPYVLHKRHIFAAAEKATGDTRLYATLPARHFPSRSRSLSPGHKKPVLLTSEQKKAHMMKVKASLVSMAAELAAPRSPKSPVGVGAPTKRVFDFVVCSRLPPRDSFSSRDDTLDPPDEDDITLIPRDKKVSSTEKKASQQSETESSQVFDITSAEDAEKAVHSESELTGDVTEKASTSELPEFTAGSPTIEISTVHKKVSLNVDELEGTGEERATEVEKLRTPEGLESESGSEGKPIVDEAATPELEDEVNRILSECEVHVSAEDNGSLASGVSGKFTDESPEVETSRDLQEANSRTHAMPVEGATLSGDRAGVSLSPPVAESSIAAAESYDDKPLPDTETDSERVAESLPAETEVRPSVTALEYGDQSVNGVLTQSDEYQPHETDSTSLANNAAELAEAEQRLLLELQANELAGPADNISSSSHSLNDQLDAEVLQSFANVPPAVDAACRLSESSVDGPATCGFGRNVHLLDWLEEQAQLRGVSSVSPHGAAEGHHDAAAISDEDDVEHAVFEDNLQDIFAALEAEVMANPFLVPITPQTSDMCVHPVTSERLSFEDDSSLGVLEASGGAVETRGVDATHHKEVLALSDEESKQIGAAGITETEGNLRRSQLSLSISSEGEVIVEHVNDLTDPLEVLEIESRAMPLQLMSKPVCLSSDSDSLSDECREEERLQDVADVLDRVDETRRLSISDLEDDEQPLTAGDVHGVPLASDTSSNSSVGPVCVDEEADALAALDEADNLPGGDAEPRHSDEEDGPSAASSSSAVDSDPAALGNFVEQVMLHHSAGSETVDVDDRTTERDVSTEFDSARQQLQVREATDEDTARSEYTLTPSCDTDILSTVAQEAQTGKVLELPQGAQAFSDAAISDDDDVEQGIEDSLQDVFAALEAEVARRCSVPVTSLTSIVIAQDSFDEDTDASSDTASKTAREQDVTSAEFAEAAATDVVADLLLRTDGGEVPEVSADHITAENSRQATADTDADRCLSPVDVIESSEAAVVEEHRASAAEYGEHDAAVEQAYDDTSSGLVLTTDARSDGVQDTRDETFLSYASEQIMRVDPEQPDANRKESDTAHLIPDTSVAPKEEAECVTESEVPLATEACEVDSKSTEKVNIEVNADEHVTAEDASIE